MTKISVYQIDEYVTADDKWIGTDVNTYNKTKNFTPRKLATYFNGSQVINTGVDLLYKYFTITPPEERPSGTLSFETEIGPTVDFSDINTFLLSKTTQKGNDVSEFLNFLVNSTSLIYKAKNINLFGSYKIVSVDTYFLDPNFFVVTVDFLEGNGFIEEDEDYMISVVELDKTIPIPQLVKETFDYTSSNSFVVANEINNVLQVIVNTTSLHPEAYTYTLPSTVTVINELFDGDVITIVYNYLEEFLEVPDLQRVTSVGNHTTNNIVLDNLPGEYGDYTTINTLTDLGTFQSYTSPTNIDYQTEYSGYGMYINEIYSPTESKEMLVSQGVIQTSYTDGDDYTSILITSSDPAIEFGKNGFIGKLKSDNIEDNITLQFPAKPLGTYTIATTEDVPPFTPSDYDLDEFTNTNTDPFAKISDIPVLGYTPVNRAGDTMLGDLILNEDPSTALGAATKQYVDNISSGINFHEPVVVATDLPLVATYNNGTAGVGATLTGPSVGVLSIDGEFPGYLDRVLVWQQADPIQNGIYDLTTVGDSVTVYQLTRSSDADNSPPGEMRYGDYTFTTSGDINGGRGFICNTTGTIVIGTTEITFVQFNAAQIVTPGYGLENTSPNVIAIDPAVTQEKITLTTTGSSGEATFAGNILNIPQYSGNPGTVTSITASSPLTGGTITSSGTIGISAATNTVDGYLTATDWTTFNSKEKALTFSTPLSRSVDTISIPAATASVSGYLTSTDFTTFTNKENSANKQNSLVADGTGTKFPTVDAVNAGLSLKANIINTLQAEDTTPGAITLALTDAGTTIPFNLNGVIKTVTVPTNSSVGFPIGTTIGLYNANIGGTQQVVISGAGVTFINNDNNLRGGDFVVLLKTKINTWIVQNTLKTYPVFINTVSSNDGSRAFKANGNGSFCFSDGVSGMKLSNSGIAFDAWSASSSGNFFNFLTQYYYNISGNTNVLNLANTFNPTSGTGTTNLFNLSPTINQTGGANGITRGLYINPTLTAAADFRAIEVTAGKVIVPTAVNSNEAINKGQVDNRLVLEKSGNYTLVNADSGGVIIFTASATLTIPTGLADGFECTFVTLAGATLTVDRGSNILYNNTGTVLLPQLSFTLKRRIATDQYITAGSL